MKFYLGTHRPRWLNRLDVPLFVSHRTLRERKGTFAEASTSWALDSGGFTELSMFGEWRTPMSEYIAATQRYADEIGHMDFAAPMDWMCEPWIISKTGKTVAEHQALTVGNYLDLRADAPALPFMPVLQGWTLGDYWSHVAKYEAAGVDLTALPRVGLGSVCRRNQTMETERIVFELAAAGVKLHGFGVKTTGLAIFGQALASCDSLAWSAQARRRTPMLGCAHKSCANCTRYALAWRERLLTRTEASWYSNRQLKVWEVA